MASQRFDKSMHIYPVVGADDATQTIVIGDLTIGTNAYTYGSNPGNSVFFMFKADHIDDLKKFKFYIVSTTTAGNIKIEIREHNYASSSPIGPASGTALSTVTVNPGTVTDGWYEVDLTGVMPSLTVNKVYFIIIGNAGGRYTIRTQPAGAAGNATTHVGAGTNANAYTGSASVALINGCSPLVLIYDDGYISGGGPYTRLVKTTGIFSGSTPQGIFISGLTEDWPIKGIQFAATSPANVVNLQIWEGSPTFGVTAPVHSESFPFRGTEELLTCWLENDFVFRAGTNYWVMLDGGTASFNLWAYEIQNLSSDSTNLLAAAFAEGGWVAALITAGAFATNNAYFPWLSFVTPYVGEGNDDVPPGGHCDCGVPGLEFEITTDGEINIYDAETTDDDISIQNEYMIAEE